jgi:hypothetical protein
MCRPLSYLAWFCLAIAGVAPLPVLAAEPKDEPIRIVVPAYFYPAGDGLAAWKRMIASADQTPITAIVNPASGPGKRVDPAYTEVFRLAQPSKIRLIGYVTLSYARRPISEVKTEIDTWLQFYPEVTGIFFDEQPSPADQAGFAREAFAYAREKIAKGAILSNPGVPCAREYFDSPALPTICVFEHREGYEKLQLPAWTRAVPRDRRLILLYDVPTAAAMRERLRSIVEKSVGCVYVTNRTGDNPWDGLPAYWDDQVAAVKQLNEREQ